ncbi:MAG: EF-hand domain-containing protein [Candidatus Muiribacteriota bacterium]
MKKLYVMLGVVVLLMGITVFSFQFNNARNLRQRGPAEQGFEHEELFNMFQIFDTDRNNLLSKEEFFDGMINYRKEKIRERFENRKENSEKRNRKPRLPKAVMEKFDTDADGVLSESEMEALKTFTKELMIKKHEEMVKKFDKDEDGKLDKEERLEMMKYMKENRPAKKITPENLDNMSFDEIVEKAPFVLNAGLRNRMIDKKNIMNKFNRK